MAIKVLLPDLTKDPTTTARFLREARTVAALQHPHVVSVYGVRENGDTNAIVMQYVDGRSLDTLLAGRSRLDLGVAGLILAQVASGLQHAHEHRTVHRDVKPANVLIDRDGRAVVSDFGIALRDGLARITDTGMVVGTMAYMSPEQRMGWSVGPAADQYALGVMAFELFAGRLPFTGSFPEMLAAHLHAPPPSLAALRPDLPAAVASTVTRMLSKLPAERFRDLREPERVFRQLVRDPQATTVILAGMSGVHRNSGVMVRRSIPAPTAPAPSSEPLLDPSSEAASRRPRRVVPLTFAVVATLAILATGLSWRLRRDDAYAGSPTSAAMPARSIDAASPTPPPAATHSRSTSSAPTPVTRASNAPRANAAGSNATLTSAPSDVRDSLRSPSPRALRDSAATLTTPAATGPGGAPSTVATNTAAPMAPASVADSRTVARQFVTMLNQRRWSEVEQLTSLGGDATLRTELVRLVHSAPDFAAGFETVASAPESATDGFTTEFVLAIEWRGGKKLVTVRLRAAGQPGQWRLAAFGTTPAA